MKALPIRHPARLVRERLRAVARTTGSAENEAPAQRVRRELEVTRAHDQSADNFIMTDSAHCRKRPDVQALISGEVQAVGEHGGARSRGCAAKGWVRGLSRSCQDGRNAVWSDPSSNENKTCITFLVLILPLTSFSTRTSCWASGNPTGSTILPPALS